jgi:signal transduction histidine kinase
VRIEVCDTGIGIAQEAQVKIFQPFTQAGAGITRQFGGTGLGLALTATCAKPCRPPDHQFGSGFGSQFCADLPLPCTPATQPPLQGRGDRHHRASSGLAELLTTLLPHGG